MPIPDAAARQLVDAGVRTLIEQPLSVLERGLRTEDVIHQAQISQATFYRKFASKSAYLSAVIDALARATTADPHAVRASVQREADRVGNALRPGVTALVDHFFDPATTPDATALHLVAHAFSPSATRSALALRDEYARRDAVVLAAMSAAFDGGGVALRRPFTAHTLAVVVTALVEGLQLRLRADHDTVTTELITDALLVVLGSVLDTAGTHTPVDDAAAPTAVDTRPVPLDTRAAFIASARSEFGRRGYFMTRIDDIAAAASVPVAAAHALFPTKPHILVAALRHRVAEIEEAVADDIVVGLGDIAVLENFLLRVARLAADELAFMDALLVAVAHDTYGEPEGLIPVREQLNLPAIIAPTIERGQHAGTFSTFASPVDIAAGFIYTLLMRCFTRRHVSPESNAAFISDLVLGGLVA